MKNDLEWARDRINEHIATVMEIEEDLKHDRMVRAGMAITQLRHMMILNAQYLGDVISGRE